MGLFDTKKPKRKPLNNLELEDKINNLEKALHLNFNNLDSSMIALGTDVRKFIEIKQIPMELIDLCQEVSNRIADGAVTPVLVYQILKMYSLVKKEQKTKPMDKTFEQAQADLKKTKDKGVVNCAKCKKPLEPGEFYILKDLNYCMSHLDEVVETDNAENPGKPVKAGRVSPSLSKTKTTKSKIIIQKNTMEGAL